MSKKSKLFAIVLALLSSILMILSIFGLGVLIGNNININKYVCITIIALDGLLLLLVILNLFRGKKFNNILKNKNGEEIISTLLSKKEEALQNIDQSYQSILKSYKRVYRFMFIFYAYQIILLFTNGLVSYSCNAFSLLEIYISINSILFLLFFTIASSIFYNLYLKLFNRTKSEIKYPLIYQFIKQICEEEGIKKDIEVVLYDQINVSISEQKHKLCIAIGIYILKFFTKEEIKSIIYHELAHYKQEHTKLSEKKDKYFNIVEALLPSDLYLLLYPKMVIVIFNNELLNHLITIYYETKADDEVLKKNVGQAYATAEVKMFGLSYAFRLQRYDIEYLLSKNHQWTKEIIEKFFDGYLSFYSQHQDFFIFASKNHLEARMATHPNVKQRVDKFATGEIDPTIIPSNDFDEDIFNFYREVNQETLSKESNEVFNQFIKDYEEFMQKKEKVTFLNLNMKSDELLSLLDQAYQYGEMEFAKACAQQIINSASEDLTRAHFILGMIEAFYEFNDECIEHLQIVYNEKNTQFKADAFDALGEYASITGKEELLNSLREKAAIAYDEQKELDNVMSIQPNDILKPFTNETVIQRIIEIAKENDEIEKICIGTKESEHMHCHQVIVFVSNKAKDFKKLEETRYQIWLYLDLEKDFYNLTFLPISVFPLNHKFKRKPLCVYTKKEYKDNK